MNNKVLLNGKINVCQLIQTIQGEGRFVGYPVILIRVYGCNLNCPFCDTKQLMYDDDITKSFTPYELSQVVNCVINKTGIEHLLITGGEPLLYKSQLIEFLDCCDTRIVEIETNGTLLTNKYIETLFFGLKNKSIKIYFNISPKSGNLSDYVFDPYSSSISFTYKLVIDVNKIDKEITRIEKASRLYYGWPIYIMPMTTSSETVDTLIEKMRKLEPVARKCNVALSNRLHLMLYGHDSSETQISYL